MVAMINFPLEQCMEGTNLIILQQTKKLTTFHLFQKAISSYLLLHLFEYHILFFMNKYT